MGCPWRNGEVVPPNTISTGVSTILSNTAQGSHGANETAAFEAGHCGDFPEPAVAGGMELALWCDLRVMEKSAYIDIYCRRWGMPLIDGGTVRLPRIVGHGHRDGPDPHRPASER